MGKTTGFFLVDRFSKNVSLIFTMSIESKHAYRFGFLKSDEWTCVRLEALLREKGMCQVCGDESIFNDAHHIWYPENIYETEECHLVILCRPCHSLIHSLFPHCKTSDEGIGRSTWTSFRNAFEAWRISKRPEIGPPQKAKELRTAYEILKEKYHLLHSKYQKAISQIEKFPVDSSKKQSD